MASLIGAEVGLDTKACDLIRRTAPLHDIGKISQLSKSLWKVSLATQISMVKHRKVAEI